MSEKHNKECGCTPCSEARIEPYKKLAFKNGDIVKHENGSVGVICEVKFSDAYRNCMSIIKYAIHWFEETKKMEWAWFCHPEVELLSATWDSFMKVDKNKCHKKPKRYKCKCGSVFMALDIHPIVCRCGKAELIKIGNS